MPTILVVDDDADTCYNVADLFGDLGYAIETANGGHSALDKAREHAYDLGLLDLRMPGMDGLTLCRHLKQLQPRMVMMIVTAYGDGELVRDAKQPVPGMSYSSRFIFRVLLALVERPSCARERFVIEMPRQIVRSGDALQAMVRLGSSSRSRYTGLGTDGSRGAPPRSHRPIHVRRTQAS